MLTGLPREAFDRTSGYARLYRSVLAKVFFGCRTSFFNSFVLCDNLRRLPSPGYTPQVCVRYYPSASTDCPCDLGVEPKVFQSSFQRIIMEKTRLFGKIFVSGFVFFTQHTVVNSWDLAALRQHLLNSGWLSLTFELTKNSKVNFD